MTTYSAHAKRDEGGWWAITVPEIDGVFTQARRLDQVEPLVRDAIALWLEVAGDSFEVTLEPSVPALDDELDEVRRIRSEADRLNDAAATATRRAVRALADRGLTMRDIGRVLGISHQRVDQLLEKAPSRALAVKVASDGTKATRAKKPTAG